MRATRSSSIRGLGCLAALLAAIGIQACDGGSSGATATSPSVPPPAEPTLAALTAASKLASQASFGLPYAEIETLAREGHEAWIEQQFREAIGDHKSSVAALLQRRAAGEFDDFEQTSEFLFFFRRLAWWHTTITARDTLRQRIAFALSEIFVVSDKVDALIVNPYALSDYYDMLLTHAFGNYRDLLRAVTLHPAMGIYLSHVNNRKSDAINNTFPDENYAREVMQLFSIGLFELEPDGTRRLDSNQRPIATYTNNEIREFAKVFTGLSYGGPGAHFGNTRPVFLAPMQMFDEYHEPGEKRLLRGLVIPAGQTGVQDLEAAIDNLFNHPNVGPFFGKQLIQRLVMSNPSPAYVARVARAFDGDASGVRGDMQAVLRAILLAPEAQAAASTGKLREPVVRYAALLRQFGASSADGFIGTGGFVLEALTRQHPLSSPSVFNFFLPAHSPAGEIADAGLVAPEFQITNSGTIVGISNLIDRSIVAGLVGDAPEPFAPVSLALDDYVALAADVDALIDRLDLMLTYGTLSSESRDIIRQIASRIDDPNARARIAIYMFLISPDYAVRL